MTRAAEPNGRSRILVADDEEDIRRLVALRLEAAGYEVVEAVNGEQALALARSNDPDLLLLDVSMPRLNGFDVCRELQSTGAVAPPVIFLTAQAQTSARIEGLESGAVDYVTKPFEPAELIARVRAALRVKASKDALAAAAATDALTGVLNRGGLDIRAEQAVALASRHARPLACVMMDIDGFKGINDHYGHAAGDAVMREVALRIDGLRRRSDLFGRYGGDEFVMLLPETPPEGAQVMGERVRQVIAEAPIALPGARISVRASVGVASLRPAMQRPEELYAAADAALYEAKRLGRDRVAVA